MTHAELMTALLVERHAQPTMTPRQRTDIELLAIYEREDRERAAARRALLHAEVVTFDEEYREPDSIARGALYRRHLRSAS